MLIKEEIDDGTKSKYDWGIQRQPIMPRERQTAKIVLHLSISFASLKVSSKLKSRKTHWIPYNNRLNHLIFTVSDSCFLIDHHLFLL
jgi:hypothetical protein